MYPLNFRQCTCFVTLLSLIVSADSAAPPITLFFDGRTFREPVNDKLNRIGGAKLIFELKELELTSDPRRSIMFLLLFRRSVNGVKKSL